MRDYVRKKSYQPMTQEKFEEAKSLINKGFSIRKAAEEIGFSEKALRNRLKANNAKGKFGRDKTFSTEQEAALLNHCIELDKRYFGLTLKSLRFLLFEYARENNIPHRFPTDTKLAGRDFTRDFMKRNKLSLRVPRKTSVARTMGFNRNQLSTYFENLKEAIRKFELGPNQIFNMDETGVQTVPNKLPKHVAPSGKRDVSKTVAAEQGQTVTAVCAVSATGQYVPPFFIYARKRMNRLLIKGGPIGCDMAITEKGYMTTPTFLTWLEHFRKHTNASESHQILLILDNHVSHTSLQAVTYAKSNYIQILTLPPHSSHRTQPLDCNFFGPLKKYYDAAVDTWDVNHPGEVFNASCVAEAFKVAFQKAATVENAVHGFASTGIFPFDADKFTDDDFLPASVTDQEQLNELESEDLEDPDNRKMVVFNQSEEPTNVEGTNTPNETLHDATPSTSANDSLVDAVPVINAMQSPNNGSQTIRSSMVAANNTPAQKSSQQFNLGNKTPEEIIPIPKIQIKRKRSGKGLKSVLLTSTPHKQKLETESREKSKLAAEKEKRLLARKRRQLFPAKKGKKSKKKVDSPSSSASESEDAMSLHNSDSDLDVGSLFNESEVEEAVLHEDAGNPDLLSSNDYCIVKVHGKTKNSFRLYVAKIISVSHGGCDCMFFKRYPNTLKFTETTEDAFVDKEDIVFKLSKPNESLNARFHKMISFPDDLSNFTLY